MIWEPIVKTILTIFATVSGPEAIYEACPYEYEVLEQQEIEGLEKAVYDATGVLLLQRKEDGALVTAVGTVVKYSDKMYSVATANHSIYDDDGNLFINNAVFSMEVPLGYEELPVPKMPEKITNPAEDYITIPLLPPFSEAVINRAIEYDVDLDFGNVSSVTAILNRDDRVIEKQFHRNLCARKAKFLAPMDRYFTSDFVAAQGMSGSPVFRLDTKDEKIRFLGVLSGITVSEECMSNDNLECGTIISPD
ncbi:hypothetical protein [Parvularcula sp. IMCC14364]|uniref:hypothetical protein n=1 Tax=Parvularcula sp. IMCC14364 TaxID=3067902 RepID=UPI0027429403|nr:hypothetical protein [Parvularcula sp. IMCC14364]